MNPFNIDEVIYYMTKCCDYPQLIILSMINKQYNKISCSVIDHYDKDTILKEFDIRPLLNTTIPRYTFNIPYFTIEKYNHLYGRFNGRVYGKDVMILNTEYIIYNDGVCILSEDSQTLFKDYQLLLITFKNM